jgi:hypothetical protein
MSTSRILLILGEWVAAAALVVYILLMLNLLDLAIR